MVIRRGDFDGFCQECFNVGLSADKLVLVPYDGSAIFECISDAFDSSFCCEDQCHVAVVGVIVQRRVRRAVDVGVSEHCEISFQGPLKCLIVIFAVYYFDAVEELFIENLLIDIEPDLLAISCLPVGVVPE